MDQNQNIILDLFQVKQLENVTSCNKKKKRIVVQKKITVIKV